MVKPKNKKNGRQKSNRNGVLRTPSQHSIYRFMRYMNAGNATGTSVDLAVLTKSSTNLLLTTGATALNVYYGALSFYVMLSDLPDYQDFTSLFDQYRIDSVELIFTPYCTQAASGAAVSSTASQSGIIVHTAVDYDDATVPTASDVGIQALREYQNYQSHNLFSGGGKPLTYRWQPRIATAAYSGAFTSYRSEPFGWVDCGSTGVQGYGFKAVFESVSAGSALGIMFKAEARVGLSFRNVR
jgi:hypothetical protein